MLFLGLGALLFITACGGGSSGGDNSSAGGEWLIPEDEVRDGGPGKDGIPSLDSPIFLSPENSGYLADDDLVIGVVRNGEARAYPHRILDWHEVANDEFGSEKVTINYCPLTGSAMMWQGDLEAANAEFGVSGLLFNSNLIMYDRESDTYWSQMLATAVHGPRIDEKATLLPMVETTWATWRSLYPDTAVLSRSTGFSRDYSRYPYGSFRTDQNLLFPVANSDNRLHPKLRVFGISQDGITRAYPIEAFADGVQVINDVNEAYVVVGSSGRNFAAAFSATLDDGTQLTFSPIQDDTLVMEDESGTRWDLFGQAQEGPRVGEQLTPLFSYTAYWYAWAAFFPTTEVMSP